MLCHVLTTQQSAGKTTNQVPKNKKGSQKEKKECGLNCYLDTYRDVGDRRLWWSIAMLATGDCGGRLQAGMLYRDVILHFTRILDLKRDGKHEQ